MEDSFIGQTFNDGNLTVIGIAGRNKQGGRLYQCHCSECAKDPELHGDATFRSLKQSLVNRCLPCGCSKRPLWTADQYKILIQRKSNNKYTCIVPESAKAHDKVQCTCLVKGCGHSWSASISMLSGNGTGCPKCAARARGEAQTIPESEALDRVRTICSEKNWTFRGFKAKWKNVRSRLLLECHCGYRWEPTFTSASHSNSGCRKCSGSLPILENEAISRVQSVCSEKNWTFHGFKSGWKYNTSRLLLTCHCGWSWDPDFSNVINRGSGCPSCAKSGFDPSKRGWFYTYLWTHPNGHRFLKYGITNKPKQRLAQQKSKTKYTATRICSLSFDDGQIAQYLERQIDIHKKFNNIPNQVSREDFYDGFSETLPVNELGFIADLVQRETMCRIASI